MSKNKNQHYVPKVVFRPFSSNGKGKSIHMLLKRSGEIVFGVSVSDQCSKDYLYGENPKLESAIQFQEGLYGKARAAILENRFPFWDDDKKVFLKRFVLLQHDRTMGSIQDGQNALQLMRDGIAQMPGSETEPVPDTKTMMQYAMHAYVENMPMLDDLSLCLLRNRTCSQFVLGDDPAVHTNRWQFQKQNRQTFGPGHAGTLFYLPISPEICILFYDGGVYTVNRNGCWFDIKKESDVRIINQLQFANARDAIYFSETMDGEQIAAQFAGFRSLWPQSLRHNSLKVGELTNEIDDFKRYQFLADGQTSEANKLLVHVQACHAQPPEWPSFIRYRSNPKFIDTNSGKGIIRQHTAVWHHGSEWV